MADWATISALATAGGTLVLAGATFASVRSANRAARAAERSLLASLRPLLMQSRLDDPPQKVGFADRHWLVAEGGGGAADVTDEAVYLAIALRNAGSGIAVLHGWYLHASVETSLSEHAPLERFERLTRDLYIASDDVGFWQGVNRDPSSEEYAIVRAAIEAREPMMVELLYGDHEGGQRVITRFVMWPREGGEGWLAVAGRHWHIDRDDPR